jgi:hypothetical protein
VRSGIQKKNKLRNFLGNRGAPLWIEEEAVLTHLLSHSAVIHLALIVVEGRNWKGPMLNKLSNDIAECYRHADECAQKAKSERDARLRQDFFDAERRWLSLARSYEITEELTACGQSRDQGRDDRRYASQRATVWGDRQLTGPNAYLR